MKMKMKMRMKTKTKMKTNMRTKMTTSTTTTCTNSTYARLHCSLYELSTRELFFARACIPVLAKKSSLCIIRSVSHFGAPPWPPISMLPHGTHSAYKKGTFFRPPIALRKLVQATLIFGVRGGAHALVTLRRELFFAHTGMPNYKNEHPSRRVSDSSRF